MKKAILFIDLDDTIFQTKRKNQNGINPVTQHEDPKNISYMTHAQDIFTDIFFSYPDIEIIPVTARNIEQYSRTYLSNNPKINIFVTCFGANITINNTVDPFWENFIKEQYMNLKPELNFVMEKIIKIANKENFNIHLSEDKYIVIKNKSKDVNVYTLQNQILKNDIIEFLDDKYFLHFNSNHLSVMPRFIDKKCAVEYLINKYQPQLTIGAGDSLSDYNFMSLCNYKIIPHNSQIENLLLSSQKINQTILIS